MPPQKHVSSAHSPRKKGKRFIISLSMRGKKREGKEREGEEVGFGSFSSSSKPGNKMPRATGYMFKELVVFFASRCIPRFYTCRYFSEIHFAAIFTAPCSALVVFFSIRSCRTRNAKKVYEIIKKSDEKILLWFWRFRSFNFRLIVSEKTTEDYSDGTYCSFPIIFFLSSFSFPAKNRLFSAGWISHSADSEKGGKWRDGERKSPRMDVTEH